MTTVGLLHAKVRDCGENLSRSLFASPAEGFKKIADGGVLICFMAHGKLRVDAIFYPPAFLLLGYISLSFEVSDYFACRPLGYARGCGKLQSGDSRLLGDKAQNQSMIGEKGPFTHCINSPSPNYQGNFEIH